MVRSIDDYKSVGGRSLDDLNGKVKNLITSTNLRDNQSWEPQGGIFISAKGKNEQWDSNENHYFQAMVLVQLTNS